MKHLKNWLVTGLFVWMPIGLTIWLITLILHFIDQIVPQQFSTDQIFGFHIPGIGLLVVIFILLITGIIATNMLGQTVIGWGNKLIMNIPIVKSIYKGIKQVSDTLLSSNGHAFRQALLIKFPNNTTWTIAFITGLPNQGIIKKLNQEDDTLQQEFLSVYVPTTPNPTSGYFVIVKKSDTKPLDMTVDEALRYIISMGTVDPTTNSK